MPEADSRRVFFSLRNHRSSLNNEASKTIFQLFIQWVIGMGSSCVPAIREKCQSSRKGVWSGKSTKRNRASKHFVPFVLINVR